MRHPSVLLIAILMLSAAITGLQADMVYDCDFESGAGSEWSNTAVDVTPAGSRHFLGRFGNQTANLSLRDLPVHTQVTVSFDLYIIRSWDGNSDFCCGPDVWDLSLVGVGSLVHTTFSNTGNSGNRQSYPGGYYAYPEDYPGSDYADRTGALECNTLGYPAEGDAVYHMTVSFAHSGPLLSLSFRAAGLEGVEWESWGLDNVQVRAASYGYLTPIVWDDGTYTSSTDRLHASLLAYDASGIIEYKYAIGTSPTDLIVGWKSAGTREIVNPTVASSQTVEETGLSLESGKTYYWYASARSGNGIWGPIGSSDGITVDATPPTQYIMSTIAGTGTEGNSGDGGPATSAKFQQVTSMAADNSGNVYICDWNNQRIRRIDASGNIHAVCPGGNVFNDPQGNVYVISDAVYRLNPDGSLVMVPGTEGNVSPIGTQPAMDALGNIYRGIFGHEVKMYCGTSGRYLGIYCNNDHEYTVAGTGVAGYNGDNLPATAAQLNYSWGAAVDHTGNLLIGDFTNRRIRRVDQQGIITTIAGNGTQGRAGDGGYALNALLTGARALFYDKQGDLYVVDRDSHTILKIDVGGKISTVAGRRSRMWYWHNTFSGDGGPAVAADLDLPMAVTVDKDGSIYIADAYNYRIRKAAYANSAMPPVVRDQGTYTASTDSLVMWWGSYDRESGIAEYQYAVGTTPGGYDVRALTSAGTWMDYTITGLSLTPGQTYYVSVKARNGADQWSPVGTSDGITVAVTSTMATVESSATGMPVLISDAVVTLNATNLQYLWIESPDRSCAMKALGQWIVNRGDKLLITGVPTWIDGIPVLANSEVKTVTATNQHIRPLGLIQRNLANDPTESLQYVGVNPVGLLVTAWGNVTAVDPADQYFYIDDGSHLTDGTSTNGVPNVGVRVIAWPSFRRLTTDSVVRVTGIRTVHKITLEADAVVNGRNVPAGEEIYIPAITHRDLQEIVVLN